MPAPVVVIGAALVCDSLHHLKVGVIWHHTGKGKGVDYANFDVIPRATCECSVDSDDWRWPSIPRLRV